MAMNGDQMAAEVLVALEGAGAGAIITDKFAKAFCNAVVAHIQANADVKAGIISTGPDPQGGTVTVTSAIHVVGIS